MLEGSDGDVFMWATNLQAAADANNYILIKAEGTYFAQVGLFVQHKMKSIVKRVFQQQKQTGQVWNGGSCCAPATTNAVDDVTYVRNIIGDLAFRGIDFDGLRVSAIGKWLSCSEMYSLSNSLPFIQKVIQTVG